MACGLGAPRVVDEYSAPVRLHHAPFAVAPAAAVIPNQAERVYPALVTANENEVPRRSRAAAAIVLAEAEGGQPIRRIRAHSDFEAVITVDAHAIDADLVKLQPGQHFHGRVVRDAIGTGDAGEIDVGIAVVAREIPIRIGAGVKVHEPGVVEVFAVIQDGEVGVVGTVQAYELLLGPPDVVGLAVGLPGPIEEALLRCPRRSPPRPVQDGDGLVPTVKPQVLVNVPAPVRVL